MQRLSWPAKFERVSRVMPIIEPFIASPPPEYAAVSKQHHNAPPAKPPAAYTRSHFRSTRDSISASALQPRGPRSGRLRIAGFR
jgi:hypothetical protein